MPGEHYFSSQPTSGHRWREIVADLGGRGMRLLTDAGVFARGGIDRGTRRLIENLAVPPGARRLVDLGCGYGPIGLALAAMAPMAEVYLVDVNERACELARLNAANNGLSNAIVRLGSGLSALEGAFDLIATNPPIRAGKRVVYGLMAEAAERLRPGGELWVVARTAQGALSLARELRRLFPEVEEMAKGGGFRVYRARRGPV